MRSLFSVLAAALGVLMMGAVPRPAQPPSTKAQVQKEQPPAENNAKDAKPVSSAESTATGAKGDDESSPGIAYRRLCDAKERTLMAALNKTTTINVDNVPLSDAIEVLQGKWDMPIVLDQRGLKEASITPEDTRVSVNSDNFSRRTALELLLNPHKLGWTIAHEAVWISTQEEINARTSVKVYDVTDLAMGDEVSPADLESVLELITSTIEPQTWDTVGGRGTIKGLVQSDNALLVVGQTGRIHEELANLFADLRQAKRAKPKSADAGTAAPAKRERLAATAANVTPGESHIAQSNNQFACDLYAKLGGKNENIVFSPLSITTALAMTYAGARHETADEFAKVLHLSLPQESLPGEMAALTKSLSANRKTPDQPQFTLANRLWCQQGHVLLEPFLQTCRESYGADVGLVDFMKQPETARKTINGWVSEKTNKKIPELLAAGSINPSDETRLVLTNAIYFNGKWETTFDKTATAYAPFFRIDAEAKQTSPKTRLMQATDTYRYTRIDGVQILELPYQGTDLAMAILLPQKGAEPFAALRANLSADKLDEWFAALKPRLVNLHLPSYKMTSDVPLKRTLVELGLRRAFDATKESVDFSGMDGKTGDEALVLTDAVHQAFIDVNEEGTEAAAATAIVGGFGGGISSAPLPITFRADHPFIYLIRDARTGCIVFLGQFHVPSR